MDRGRQVIVSERRIKILDRRRQLLLWPLAALVRLWGRTVRIEIAPDDEKRLRDTSEPTIIVCWHNRLFLSAEIYRRFRRRKVAYALVSASRDGAWLTAFLALMGVRTVRGSSSQGGREGISELIVRLRDGDDIAITPDGPRGPAYSFKPGAAIAARRTGARVLVVGTTNRSAWHLKSWDRFVLPKPFSRVRIRSAWVFPDQLPAGMKESVDLLRRNLEEVNF